MIASSARRKVHSEFRQGETSPPAGLFNNLLPHRYHRPSGRHPDVSPNIVPQEPLLEEWPPPQRHDLGPTDAYAPAGTTRSVTNAE
ncbi:hypothetical protein KCP75_15850 [Salmonella enterica subsp. enterica]|nr:hypothetical protein KCP75_15850 [Salmonella enterica subsp. enterica]